VEPFAGSAALFYAINPNEAILSDSNQELVRTFEQVRDNAARVYECLSELPLGRESFYRLRALDPHQLRSAERAARFIFLNRFCFNGLYRTNAKGHFNVPYAATKTGGLPPRSVFLRSAGLLAKANLYCGDFQRVLEVHVRKGDFVYLDPPYAVGNRRIFNQYGPHTFGLHDLERLRLILREIDQRKATFVLTYAWCREATTVFAEWGQRRVYTQRNIAGFAKHRRTAAELIVSNFVVQQASARKGASRA
jgi:DNA adenine methylase